MLSHRQTNTQQTSASCDWFNDITKMLYYICRAAYSVQAININMSAQ